MIKIDNEKAIMEFGKGDIGINTYIRTDIDEKGIIFYNQEPRRIGAVADIKANTMIENINDYPIKMVFPKIESVDVVIDMLVELKGLIYSNTGIPNSALEECPCMKEPGYNCGMKCSRCGREL